MVVEGQPLLGLGLEQVHEIQVQVQLQGHKLGHRGHKNRRLEGHTGKRYGQSKHYVLRHQGLFAVICCGDAAGRIKKTSDGKKDFSCSDRLFALNIWLPFWTPEQHFLGRKTEEDYKLPEFDPNELGRRFESISQDTLMQKGFLLQGNPKYVTLTSIKLEVIMLVGVQGSGKSTLASNWFSRSEPKYVVLSNDRLGSREKTLSALRKNLKASNSCIIDNTHVDIEARKKFLEVAKEFDVPVRAFVMSTSLAHAKHNNIYREIIDTSKNHAKIGEALMHQFKNKYQEPSLDEGFTEIVKINVAPKFLFEQHRQIYFMYLQEK